jgi:hypothetical protein
MKTVTFPEKIFYVDFDLAVLIDTNGAGHHKRIFGALDLILQAQPQLLVAVFCDQKTTERFMGDFAPLQRVAEHNVTFIYGVVSPGLDIMAKDPTIYTNGQWFEWVERLRPYREILLNAYSVWADALPQVLILRPDTIFSSSFTFGPVIEERWGSRDDELGRMAKMYASQEELLMKTYLPRYVTVGLLSMPFMEERARVKKVGIMADFEPVPRIPTKKPLVGIRGGLTGLAGEILGNAIRLLQQQSGIEIHVDKAFSKEFPDLPVLGYGPEDYAKLSAAVIRPGAGETTNCVTASVPVVAISEPDLEMNWNGQSLEREGLGLQVSWPEAVVAALESILTPQWQETYTTARAKVSIDGLKELANEILSTLK